MSKKILVIVLVAFITMIASVSVARANHETLNVCCAWNSDLADGILTYSISGGTQEARDAVKDAVTAWHTAVDDLTLLETSDKKPNIKIRLKGGGALTAGQAVRHFDGVHIKSVDLTISSKAFGEPNELPKIEQIALHELGHSLGDGHANFPDLMAPVLGPVSTISTCDVDGVRAANAWYFDNPNDPGMPVAPAVSEVECGSGSAPANDVGLTAITGPETAAQGDTVVISLTVFNHGTNSATFNLTASKAAPGPESASLLVTLNSGESGDFTLTWPTDAGTSLGLHTWTFTHDLSGDGDSANDTVYHTVEITEPSEEEPDCPPRSRSPQCRNP